ncbi:hypothetical protein DPMN_150573 [Dreissena polymorpha]|uniref:Copper transport protein n=1 Tax=Dreissena polymorpha TaxID=45954 RepID=A0A9D4FJK1_DREPO|nr:hypothetical protein DPMN_150573 [Dreissena polymorpha]
MSHNHMNHSMMTTASNMNHDHMNHNPGMHMDMNNTGGCDSMGMMMYFHEGNCEYVLFEGLHVTTAGGMVGACFAIFALGVLYEGLKVLRETLLQRAMVSKYASSANGGSQDAMVINNKNVGSRRSIHMMSGSHFLQTLLHMIQVFISYCLMLIFMTYNVWLCLSVILGAGVGYFLFGWRKAIVVDINEHCH